MADWQRICPFWCPELDLLSLFGHNLLFPRQVATEKIGNHETTEAEDMDLVCKTERSALHRYHDEDLELLSKFPVIALISIAWFWGVLLHRESS